MADYVFQGIGPFFLDDQICRLRVILRERGRAEREQRWGTKEAEILRDVGQWRRLGAESLKRGALPDNLASVQIVITGAAMSVDVATGLGGAEVVQTKTIEVPSANLGKKDCKFASFLFLPEDVESVDIAVTALDADGEEIVTLEFEEVEVQTNYITRYKGQMFGRTPKFEISVSSDFAGEKEFEF